MRLTHLHGLRQGIALAAALTPPTDFDTLLRIDQRTLWQRAQDWDRADTLPAKLRPAYMTPGIAAAVCATRSVSGTCPVFYLNPAGEFVVERYRALTTITPDTVRGDREHCALAVERIDLNYGAHVTVAQWLALLDLLLAG